MTLLACRLCLLEQCLLLLGERRMVLMKTGQWLMIVEVMVMVVVSKVWHNRRPSDGVLIR